MNFYKRESWATYPKIDQNHHVFVTASQEQHIHSNELVEIQLGLILMSLPKNYIIKIINTQHKFKIVSKFWLASGNELTLVIVSNMKLTIHVGDILCHLQLLPVQLFLPGK